MLYKTRGIALSYIKFRESSIITRIFTETFGMQSYIVNSVRSRNAKTKIALFQPLTLLELVVYHNKKKEINRISEIKSEYNFHSIPYEIRKTSIALFVTELLNQTLHEEGENEPLFEFIHDSILAFDTMQDDVENFHLQFLIQYSRYLGIKPESAGSMLKEIGHSKMNQESFNKIMDQLIDNRSIGMIKMGKSTRNEILMAIIDYYRYHFDSIKEIKSIQVLKEVLDV